MKDFPFQIFGIFLGLLLVGAVILFLYFLGSIFGSWSFLIIIAILIFSIIKVEIDKSKDKESKIEIIKETKLNSNINQSSNDYGNIDDTCNYCGGSGVYRYCLNCNSVPNYYEGEFYCEECFKSGEDSINIMEDTCIYCDGKGYDLD